MGESEAERYSLTNTRDQPVELLLPTGTVTLPPYGRIELAAEATLAPQILELCRRRLLTLRPLTPTPVTPEAATPEGPEDESRPTRRRSR